MGLFKKFADMIGMEGKDESRGEEQKEGKAAKKVRDRQQAEDIVPAAGSHIVKDSIYAGGENDEDLIYEISFELNDAFKEAKSHAGEVEMLSVYAPTAMDWNECTLPSVSIILDDKIYEAVEEFKEKGTITGAIELTALSGKFYFKAKMEYFEDMVYFYGVDRCDGYWENNGLCMVYQKEYVGTENERTLMRILDEAAESYCEIRVDEV